MTGRRNASVLPEPVLAAPMRSLPAKSDGMARDWICVMRVNVRVDSASCVLEDRGREANVSVLAE